MGERQAGESTRASGGAQPGSDTMLPHSSAACPTHLADTAAKSWLAETSQPTSTTSAGLPGVSRVQISTESGRGSKEATPCRKPGVPRARNVCHPTGIRQAKLQWVGRYEEEPPCMPSCEAGWQGSSRAGAVSVASAPAGSWQNSGHWRRLCGTERFSHLAKPQEALDHYCTGGLAQ